MSLLTGYNQIIWPKLGCVDGASLELHVERPGAYGPGGQTWLRFEDDGQPPITNDFELSSRFLTSEGLKAIDNFSITFKDVTAYTAKDNTGATITEEFGGPAGVDGGFSSVLERWFYLTGINDPAYTIWIAFYDKFGNLTIPFVGQYRAKFKSQRHGPTRDLSTNFETRKGTRTIQVISVESLLALYTWQAAVANFTESDCQRGTFYSGYIQPSPSVINDLNEDAVYNRNLNSDLSQPLTCAAPYMQQHWAGFQDNTYAPLDLGAPMPSLWDAKHGPNLFNIVRNTNHNRADSGYIAWPDAWPIGTWGIKIQKIVSTCLSLAGIALDISGLDSCFDTYPQYAANGLSGTVAQFPINTHFKVPPNEMYVCANTYMGYHPFDGMCGNRGPFLGVGSGHLPCAAVATSNIVATYNNGSSGVGATLTGLDSQFPNSTFAIDGYVAVTNDRILIAGQTDQTQNGIYVFTSDVGGTFVLTRASDFDGSSPFFSGEDEFVLIAQGLANQGSGWAEQSADPLTGLSTAIIFGTTDIVFYPSDGTGYYWNNPAAFKRTDSVQSVLKSIFGFLGANGVVTCNATSADPNPLLAGNVVMSISPLSSIIGGIPIEWEGQLELTEMEAPNQITNVTTVNAGDSLTVVCPLVTQLSPVNYVIPFRERKIAYAHSVGAAPLPVPALMDLSINGDLVFDGAPSLGGKVGQADECFKVCDFLGPLESGVWTPNVNPNCWKGLCGVYFFNPLQSSPPGDGFPYITSPNTESWSLYMSNYIEGGAGYIDGQPNPGATYHTLTDGHSGFNNAFFSLGWQYAKGATPDPNEANANRASSIIYQAVAHANYEVLASTVLQREYRGQFGTGAKGMQASWRYDGVPNATFNAIELHSRPKRGLIRVVWNKLPSGNFPDITALTYGFQNGTGGGLSGTSTSPTGGGGTGGGGGTSSLVLISWTPVTLTADTADLIATLNTPIVELLVTGAFTLTGVTANATCGILIIKNVGTGIITLVNQNASGPPSAVQNQFYISGGQIQLETGATATFLYERTTTPSWVNIGFTAG